MEEQNSSIDLKHYHTIALIGEGSFSKVYRVRDDTTNEYYAAKVSKFMVDEDTKENKETLLLFREVNLMSLLNHPSIVKLVGYCQNDFDGDPCPIILTEFASNGSLRDIIEMEQSGLSPPEWNETKKLIIIYGIASGMSYLHANNVIHRDLKPENILIDDFLHPKISDFGLSKILDFLSISMIIQSQKGVKGTPIYMSPEAFDEKYSKASDVYAFSIIVYEIVTGDKPFNDRDINFMKILSKINEGWRPEINVSVHDAYRELIENCWSQSPDDRPSFEDIVECLKTNKEFITESIDKSEFLDYVDFIEKASSTFEKSNQMFHFDYFIKEHGRNKVIQKVTLNADKKEASEITKNLPRSESNSKILTSVNESESRSEVSISNIKNPNKIKEEEEFGKIVEDDDSNSEEERHKIEKEEKINWGIANTLFSIPEFDQLNEENQNLVLECTNDMEKQFKVGQYLIEGLHGFPQNISKGMKYLKKTLKSKFTDATIYYIEMLIKGKLVRQDLFKAKKYLEKIKEKIGNRYFYFLGRILYKENQFKNAKKTFDIGASENCVECMYESGKMTFLGEGVIKNVKKSLSIIECSKALKYDKSEYFLASFQKLNQIEKFNKLPQHTQFLFISNEIKNIMRNKNNSSGYSIFNEIRISFAKTEMLYFNKSLKSAGFHSILQKYKEINIEIEYSSKSFQLIFNLVSMIQKKIVNNIKICIVFFNIPSNDSDIFKYDNIFEYSVDTSINIEAISFSECSSLTQISIPSSEQVMKGCAFPWPYKGPINRCWSQNPDNRPTFGEIVEELQTNEGFITEKVSREEFEEYFDFISSSKVGFGPKNSFVQIIDFITRHLETIKVCHEFNTRKVRKEDFNGLVIAWEIFMKVITF